MNQFPPQCPLASFLAFVPPAANARFNSACFRSYASFCAMYSSMAPSKHTLARPHLGFPPRLSSSYRDGDRGAQSCRPRLQRQLHSHLTLSRGLGDNCSANLGQFGFPKKQLGGKRDKSDDERVVYTG